MKLEKGKISSSQLIFIIAGFMQGTTFITAYTFSNTPRDEWLVILISFAIFIPFALMYLKLSSKFPNDNLIQIFDKVYGNVLGKALSSLYLLYFILMCAGNLRFPSSYLVSVFMPETPILAFAVFLVVLCVWAVKGGIETIARLGLFTAVLVLVSFIGYFLLILNRIELKHYLPIMDVTPLKVLHNVNIMGSEYMSEVFIFSMFLPCISDKNNLKKNYFIGASIGIFSLLIVALIVTGVLGNIAGIYTGPLIESTRNIQMMDINIRTEFIFMGFLVISAFFKCSVLIYVTVLSLSYLFKLRSYTLFVIPVGLLAYSLMIPFSENIISFVALGRNLWAFISVTMLNILPAVTLITAAVRGLPQKQGGGGA